MPPKITAPVDVKDPAWRDITDSAVRSGSVAHLRGTTPPGLPAGGYWEYRKRVNKGRVYLMYNLPAQSGTRGRAYVIASVDPEYADEATAWKPKPNGRRSFDFDSGPVVVHYDALALPARIVPMEATR